MNQTTSVLSTIQTVLICLLIAAGITVLVFLVRLLIKLTKSAEKLEDTVNKTNETLDNVNNILSDVSSITDTAKEVTDSAKGAIVKVGTSVGDLGKDLLKNKKNVTAIAGIAAAAIGLKAIFGSKIKKHRFDLLKRCIAELKEKKD